jgi:hypothetical protein
MIRPDPCFLPAAPAVAAEQHLCHSGITAESNPPHCCCLSNLQHCAVMDVGEEGPRWHPVDGDHLHPLLPWYDVGEGRVGIQVSLGRPEVVVGFVEC